MVKFVAAINTEEGFVAVFKERGEFYGWFVSYPNWYGLEEKSDYMDELAVCARAQELLKVPTFDPWKLGQSTAEVYPELGNWLKEQQ